MKLTYYSNNILRTLCWMRQQMWMNCAWSLVWSSILDGSCRICQLLWNLSQIYWSLILLHGHGGHHSRKHSTRSKITKILHLTFYDVKKPIVVNTDVNCNGLREANFQHKGAELKHIAYCSYTMTNMEPKYAQIEKKRLAGVLTFDKFFRYLVGLNIFKLFTDHKPL